MELKDKVVAITGAAGGIGRAASWAFARQGARVTLLDVHAEGLQGLADTLAAAGSDALPLPGDLTDAASCAAAMDAIGARWGGVDVLVNNAGISHRSLFRDTTPDVLRRVMEVNFFGTVNITRAALPSLVARRGQIVAVTSVAGFAPLLGRTGYAASKHALHGFFDTLREELRADGVSVSLVCPSFVDTPLKQSALAGDGNAVRGGKAEVGKALTPAQVADALVDVVVHDRRQVVLSPIGRAAWWLTRFAPATYARIMRRTQLKEFDADGS